jgi:hypothetical protein
MTGLNPLRTPGILAGKSGAWAEKPAPRRYAAAAMTREERYDLETSLARLQQEHRDLDAAIEALYVMPGADVIQLQRLKKRKLSLRDRIRFIENQLTPDIIA